MLETYACSKGCGGEELKWEILMAGTSLTGYQLLGKKRNFLPVTVNILYT